VQNTNSFHPGRPNNNDEFISSRIGDYNLYVNMKDEIPAKIKNICDTCESNYTSSICDKYCGRTTIVPNTIVPTQSDASDSVIITESPKANYMIIKYSDLIMNP
jgi:hypothetical protein